MANSNITISQEYRPCMVKEKRALFHGWVHTKNLLGQEFEVGIVEYENRKLKEKITELENEIQDLNICRTKRNIDLQKYIMLQIKRKNKGGNAKCLK